MYTVADVLTAALFCVLVILLVTIAARAWLRRRITPEERERRRRSTLLAAGQMGDANLVEVRDNLLVYSYDVRGVHYTTSQDISGLEEVVPAGLAALGPISIRYDPRNPANSIVITEQWSGL